MTVEYFIKTDFQIASAFAGVADLKNKLLTHLAIVIMEDDQYFGVLTPYDIIKKPHILAIDCLSIKPEVYPYYSVDVVLSSMKQENTDVLPVFENNSFIGLVFKSDILEYFTENKDIKTLELEQHVKMLEAQNSKFKEKIELQKLEIEQIIENRTKELLDLVETKEKFIRIIAHELRNPFNTILGFLTLLLKNLRNYDIEKIEKFLTQIYRSTNVTFDLLVNLLEWLNVKNRKIPYNPEKTCVYTLMNEEHINTSVSADQKHITVMNAIPKKLFAHVDRNMIKTILRNLISNAIKYSDLAGIIIVSAKEVDQYIEVTVKDNGIGLSQEVIDSIFQSEDAITTKGTANEIGTGLGLLLCKEFVEIEGGTIWIESSVGQGSEFKFTIPKSTEIS